MKRIEIREHGTKWYYNNDQLHREDGPAIEYVHGVNKWYINGVQLTEEEFNHQKFSNKWYWRLFKNWFFRLFNKNDTIVIRIDILGNHRYINEQGQIHREDGPAVIYTDGTKFWYINNKLHREDGPAYEGPDGSKEWYINDEELSEEEFNRHTKNPCKLPDYLK